MPQPIRLSTEHKVKLRQLDAERTIAEAGHHTLTLWDADQRVIRYMQFIEDLHVTYDLEEDVIYQFDAARGLIFED